MKILPNETACISKIDGRITVDGSHASMPHRFRRLPQDQAHQLNKQHIFGHIELEITSGAGETLETVIRKLPEGSSITSMSAVGEESKSLPQSLFSSDTLNSKEKGFWSLLRRSKP